MTVTGSGTTAADGSFSAVIPGGAGNADYTVWPTGLLGSAFFTVVPASFTLHVRHVPLSASIYVARGRLRGERVQMQVCIAQRAVDATPP